MSSLRLQQERLRRTAALHGLSTDAYGRVALIAFEDFRSGLRGWLPYRVLVAWFTRFGDGRIVRTIERVREELNGESDR